MQTHQAPAKPRDYTIPPDHILTWITAPNRHQWRRSKLPPDKIPRVLWNLGGLPRDIEPKAAWSAFRAGFDDIAIHPSGFVCIRPVRYYMHMVTITPDGIARMNGREFDRTVLGYRCGLCDNIEAIEQWVLRGKGRSLPRGIPILRGRMDEARREREAQEAWDEANLTPEELEDKRFRDNMKQAEDSMPRQSEAKRSEWLYDDYPPGYVIDSEP